VRDKTTSIRRHGMREYKGSTSLATSATAAYSKAMDCDIAIIGYGPVGATAAALLGGQGLSVPVIKRMAGVYDKPRAITADHEVMRCMQFAGIGQELAAHVRPHPGTRYL